LSGLWTVVASALIFGVFHELLFPGRLLASTFIGLVLGWVRLRTGSILPGILLHAIHNIVLLAIIYYRDELQARGWGIEEQTHLPLTWHALAVVGIAVGLALMLLSDSHEPQMALSGAADA
jgi:ABC-2 type transport system permease protein/sodium transport system permease protein